MEKAIEFYKVWNGEFLHTNKGIAFVDEGGELQELKVGDWAYLCVGDTEHPIFAYDSDDGWSKDSFRVDFDFDYIVLRHWQYETWLRLKPGHGEYRPIDSPSQSPVDIQPVLILAREKYGNWVIVVSNPGFPVLAHGTVIQREIDEDDIPF